MTECICLLRLIGVMSHASAKDLANALARYEVSLNDIGVLRHRHAIDLYADLCNGRDQFLVAWSDQALQGYIAGALNASSCSALWKSPPAGRLPGMITARHAPSQNFVKLHLIGDQPVMPIHETRNPKTVEHHLWWLDFVSQPAGRFMVTDSNHELLTAAQKGIDIDHIEFAQRTLGKLIDA
jgi:hypothetical protein